MQWKYEVIPSGMKNPGQGALYVGFSLGSLLVGEQVN